MINKLCLIWLFSVDASQIMKLIPQWYDVQGLDDSTKYVVSVVDCARFCYSRISCDYLAYNETTKLCRSIEHVENGVIQAYNNFMFYRQKGCLYSGYEYIWELDACIKFSSFRNTWNDSQQMCQDEEGGLLVVESLRKDSYFRLYLMRIHALTNTRNWWIGGTDAAEEGQFRWINGQNVTYSNWENGQPDDSVNLPDEDCIRYLVTAKTAKWHDYDCSDKKHSICENKKFL